MDTAADHLEFNDRLRRIEQYYGFIMSDTDSCTESEASNIRNISSWSSDSVDDAFSTTASVGSAVGGRVRDLTLDFPDDMLNSSNENVTDLNFSLSTQFIDTHGNRNSSPRTSRNQNQQNQRVNNSNPVAVIDLEMPRPIPEVEDDEVIFVSSNVEYIDLCTPTNPRTVPRQNNIRRSVAVPLFNDIENVSPPKRRRHTEAQAAKPEELNSSQDQDIRKALQCSICLETMIKRYPTTTKCGHVFCRECILQALNATKLCPICRRKVTVQSLRRVHF